MFDWKRVVFYVFANLFTIGLKQKIVEFSYLLLHLVYCSMFFVV